ncbi:Cytochrome b5 heme-binding domain-containing protein [Psidium guajava]|nr:Cytochrome b5 heme-binding domain-containing protein [Psidium guajava]
MRNRNPPHPATGASAVGVDSFPDQVLGHGFGQVAGLQRGGPQRPNGGDVGLPEGQAPVGQVVLLAQVAGQRGDPPELAAGQPREQVVLQLELEPTVEPVHPGRASDVYGPGRLLLEPVGPVGRAHVDVGREVVQAELDVLDGRDGEAGDHEHGPFLPIGQARDEQREPGPEHEDAQDVEGSIRDMSLGEQEQEGLDEEIDAPEAHDRVECPMLVAHQQPRQEVELEFPTVEDGGEGIEEPGGDGEHRDVLEVGVVVEAVAGDVVGVVGPLPPRDADPGDAVAREDLGQPVVAVGGHHLVVPRVVPNVRALDPEQPEQDGAEEVDRGALAGHHAVHAEGQHRRDGHEGPHRDVSLPLEEPQAGELSVELPVVLGHLGGDEVPDAVPGEQRVQVLPGGSGVVRHEGVGHVLAGQGEERDLAAGVALGPLGDVVHLPLDRDPQIPRGGVLLELLRRNVLLLALHR